MKNSKNTQEKLSIVLDKKAPKEDQLNRDKIEKKIKKIDLLRKQVQKLKNEIDSIKNLYSKHLGSKEVELHLNKEKLIVKLFERFQQKAFSKWQKELIETKILNEINFLIDNDNLTEKTADIHQKLTAIQQENLGDDEKEMMNEMAKEMLKNMGVEIDDDNFDFTNFANQEFRDNFQEDFHKKKYEEHNEAISEKKREKTRVTDKDFQKLYRQLVKKTHPDLVKDVASKEKREVLMKKLSHAWEERNYYQLLLLQNEIDADSSFEVLLNKNQLKVMVRQLNEEIVELESAKYELKKINPKTSFYYQNFYARSEKGILTKLEKYKEKIVLETRITKDEIRDIKSQKSTKELLKGIRRHNDLFEGSQLPDDFFDYFG